MNIEAICYYWGLHSFSILHPVGGSLGAQGFALETEQSLAIVY